MILQTSRSYAPVSEIYDRCAVKTSREIIQRDSRVDYDYDSDSDLEYCDEEETVPSLTPQRTMEQDNFAQWDVGK